MKRGHPGSRIGDVQSNPGVENIGPPGVSAKLPRLIALTAVEHSMSEASSSRLPRGRPEHPTHKRAAGFAATRGECIAVAVLATPWLRRTVTPSAEIPTITNNPTTRPRAITEGLRSSRPGHHNLVEARPRRPPGLAEKRAYA
ncbi:MAG TPA: hypothetical protein VIX82_02220 [Solirubrobacteraceae bacterium]